MTQKLTLTVHPETIRKAKEYARQKNTSVSRLFESFVETQTNDNEARIAARLEALKQISGAYSELQHLDIDAEIQKHREEKYFR
jgi:hypothetical protein